MCKDRPVVWVSAPESEESGFEFPEACDGGVRAATFRLYRVVTEACVWPVRSLLFRKRSSGVLVTLRRPHVTAHVPYRCVSLQIKAAQESADGEPPGCLLLLNKKDDCLTEIEKRLITWGYRDNCVDIRLERAKIKR